MGSASLTLMAVPPLVANGWRNRLLALAMMLFAVSCLAVGSQQGGATPVLERSVKAAFLYKFLGYLEFSSEPGPTLVVGVLGADDVAAELAQITSGRTVGNRNVSVRRLADGDALTGLQLLFVGGDANQPGAALRAAEKNGTVTVTEQDDGLQSGSVINFRLVEDRVRFEVSLPAAERCNVRLSSRLLSVAYHVQKGGQ
ncbi:YfiR family protein [Pseudoduganella violaceinigra]|uniref:YfiR family protein n=1 Tax=Pseudoduganella violaceinigra TaxID=246602 RepID=UPI000402DAF1|nr:YfiR family protein [Pseudoduganella violaceinigra]